MIIIYVVDITQKYQQIWSLAEDCKIKAVVI